MVLRCPLITDITPDVNVTRDDQRQTTMMMVQWVLTREDDGYRDC